MKSKYLKKYRYSCPKCSSKEVILWGSKNTQKRYLRKTCKKTFTKSKAKKARVKKYWKLFSEWMTSGISVENLIRLTKSDISSKQLMRYFQGFLDYAPKNDSIISLNILFRSSSLSFPTD
jgi:transposase-like protein